ncbi:hypothetical protein EMCRGX_G012378 [Ephydatia muelleri]
MRKNIKNVFAPDRKITVRISGDGAKFSRSSSFTLLSYAILVPSERYPTGPVVKGGEDYETISQATFAEINHLQHMGYVTVNGVRFQIELFLSSDMKPAGSKLAIRLNTQYFQAECTRDTIIVCNPPST